MNLYGPLPKDGDVLFDDQYGRGWLVVGDHTPERALGLLWEYLHGCRPDGEPDNLIAAALAAANKYHVFRVLVTQPELGEPGYFSPDGHGAALLVTSFDYEPVMALGGTPVAREAPNVATSA